MQINITPDGDLQAIYSEDMDLHALGRPIICRASDVEPDRDGLWTADMHRSGGPVLGPFARRSEAINAELAWLDCHLEKYRVNRLRPIGS